MSKFRCFIYIDKNVCSLYNEFIQTSRGDIMMKLTSKELRALSYIEQFIEVSKYPPTVRELQIGLGLASTSTAYGYMERLQKKGYIERGENMPRALKVLPYAH
ncbi:hypothetical protein C5G87_07180 [Paenibacillus peoriae]|nr:hypothetical protein C5G87_07180 [Paenibacillus peoriae]